MFDKLRIKYLLIFISILLLSVFAISTYVSSVKYNFDSDSYLNNFIQDFNNYIHLNDENEIFVDNEGLSLLKKNQIKLQILDSENKEIYSYNRPNASKIKYTNTDLINTYISDEYTMFLNDTNLNNTTYTIILFFKPNNIKRIMFTYDKTQLVRAHNIPLFVAIIIIIILIASCIYLLHITNPINDIVNRITALSKGNYENGNVGKGIYSDVKHSLNILSNRLYNTKLEREKLDNMRREWTANISHDIKTPLTSIRGNAEILSIESANISHEAIIKYSNIIINKSDYIKNLVDDLNLSSRLKDNNFTPNKKIVNIISLIRHVIIDISNDEKYSKSTISYKLYDKEILKELDENLMKRVFMNLIINALVHNNYDVDIKVTVSRITTTKVKITIEDNGIGISKQDIKHIFERYFRGTNTSQVTEGSGLGMAIAHDIVKAHDGNILIESKENLGTKLIIFI